jgi:SAM-dependent methyltransferase
MQEHYYLNLNEVEKKHWYFAARRQCIKDLICRYILSEVKEPHLKILDAGCGTGGTTDFLSRFGDITALELSETAINLLKINYPQLNVIKGSIENMDNLLSGENFDLVTALGVLYHKEIKNPLHALKNINHKLKIGGWLIWHEAAYPFLKRKHDELSQGARRFLPGEMENLLAESGFQIYFASHVGSFIFPFAFILALLSKIKSADTLTGGESIDRKVPPKYLNAMLYGISRLEMKYALNVFPVPIGVSYFIMAKKINA